MVAARATDATMGEYQNIYIGKIGAYNFALMFIGALFAVLYYYERRSLLLCCAIHFFTYGFLFDLYRIKFFRLYLLFNLNYTAYRSALHRREKARTIHLMLTSIFTPRFLEVRCKPLFGIFVAKVIEFFLTGYFSLKTHPLENSIEHRTYYLG